ncbi:MAG: COG1615 family transporter, partial [Acidimicrobiia bacterium]|nr:COG1615 family transporter [Acidimicrobiia bacterium]
TDPRVFFNEGDLWQIARDPSSINAVLDIETLRSAGTAGTRPMLPYYLLMTLPEEDQPSFLILQPFTPRSTPNMVGFLVAKSDAENFGEMIQYQFPQGNPPDGPNQVGGRINQDTAISSDFTLLGQQGSEIVQGNMLVVPVEESVLYVQPVYLQGTAQNALPELKRVVVVFEDRIIMRTTLDEAIDAIFGTDSGDGGGGIVDPGPVDGTVSELLARAENAFNAADAALRAGDLASYAARVAEAEDFISQAIAILNESEPTS